MKKLILSSVLGVCVMGNAWAAGYTSNRMDGNPLYMPNANQFYSLAELGSHSGSTSIKTWGLTEEFGYGITDRFAVAVYTTVLDEQSFDQWSWQDLALEATFRAMDVGTFKTDVVFGYAVSPVWANHRPFLEQKNNLGADGYYDGTGTGYTWAFGVRGGYQTPYLTIAGRALFEYWNTESFNWYEEPGKQGLHVIVLGLDGQFELVNDFNLTAGIEYMGFLDSEWYGIPGATVENAGTWTGKLGINYNIDYHKYVGAYVECSLNHQGGEDYNQWEFDNGFGFGAKFGIAF